MKLDEHYLRYYAPLVEEFLTEVRDLEHPSFEDVKKAGVPEPHFPLFGPGYEKSALRLVIVGQDTAYWGDLREFIAEETKQPGSKLAGALAEFRTHVFTGWGKQRQTFWGFAMMLLAALHGQQDWGLMKQGKMSEILDSFAWSEGNAVELYTSTAKGHNVRWDYWEKVRQAGERFNRVRHLVEALRPHVVLVLYRGLNVPRYFEGCPYEKVGGDGRLTHYRLTEAGVDVFHAPHPRSMNLIEGTDYFCTKLREILAQHHILTPFPEFLQGQEGEQDVMSFLHERSPVRSADFDKYAFVAWVADELKKRDTFMSVPALMDLVNRKGYTTNYGTPFSGGRGSFRLVSGTYHRMVAMGRQDQAHNIAVAFRRPNFEYAYEVE